MEHHSTPVPDYSSGYDLFHHRDKRYRRPVGRGLDGPPHGRCLQDPNRRPTPADFLPDVHGHVSESSYIPRLSVCACLCGLPIEWEGDVLLYWITCTTPAWLSVFLLRRYALMCMGSITAIVLSNALVSVLVRAPSVAAEAAEWWDTVLAYACLCVTILINVYPVLKWARINRTVRPVYDVLYVGHIDSTTPQNEVVTW